MLRGIFSESPSVTFQALTNTLTIRTPNYFIQNQHGFQEANQHLAELFALLAKMQNTQFNLKCIELNCNLSVFTEEELTRLMALISVFQPKKIVFRSYLFECSRAQLVAFFEGLAQIKSCHALEFSYDKLSRMEPSARQYLLFTLSGGQFTSLTFGSTGLMRVGRYEQSLFFKRLSKVGLKHFAINDQELVYFGVMTCKYFFDLIQSPSLESLDLSGSSLGIGLLECLQYLFSAIEKSNIRRLNLSYNVLFQWWNCHTRGKPYRHFYQCLQNSKVTDLDLSGNGLDCFPSVWYEKLGSAIFYRTGLQKLYVKSNDFSRQQLYTIFKYSPKFYLLRMLRYTLLEDPYSVPQTSESFMIAYKSYLPRCFISLHYEWYESEGILKNLFVLPVDILEKISEMLVGEEEGHKFLLRALQKKDEHDAASLVPHCRRKVRIIHDYFGKVPEIESYTLKKHRFFEIKDASAFPSKIRSRSYMSRAPKERHAVVPRG